MEDALIARGIRSINRSLHDQAIEVLKRFNKLEGPGLYPRVIDTECKVQGDRPSHIVDGVIDVLISANSTSTDPSAVEIWDYKGSRRPKEQYDLDTYRYQMLVYGALYRMKYGVLPKRAVLYFMNELDRDDLGLTPKDAIWEIEFRSDDIDTALKEFDRTAREIISCNEGQVWEPPLAGRIPQETCVACDIRWSCPSFTKARGKVPMRLEVRKPK